jgi:[protein-PII] uridylyltransferase
MTSCAFARVSEVPTPSEEGSPSLDEYLDLRDSLRTARRGHGGREVCEVLTASLDRAVGKLVTPLPDEIAIVAIGGYGRGELSPFSDVDLMVLHAVDDPSDVAAALFRPLWDAKLRVGHSVRTLREAATAAKERFDTQTTLLTSRLIAGDSDMFGRLMTEVAAVTRARPLRRYLVSEERERRRLSPYLLMATDVKTGRGGLRTLQGFEWEERRGELIGRFSAESGEEEERASESLLQVRNALHVSAGRRHDVFSPDLREPAARWLGDDELETATRLVDALQTVDRLATRRWPEVVDTRSRQLWSRLAARASSTSSGDASVDEMIGILESGEQGRLEFERRWEEGKLRDLLPEWQTVRCLPQLATFHEHPVSAHLWRTVDEMNALIEEDGHYGRVARELDMDPVLLLSAFLHDIGKGHGGDHAGQGGTVARGFCQRLGISDRSATLIEDAVSHHLLLAVTATRRDIDDPAVIDETAETVGSLQLLQVVYLLTVADSKATGPSMWNDWKATLLRTLFARCAARFGGDLAVVEGTTPAEILALTSDARKADVRGHLDQMPGDYLRSATAGDVIWHLELIEGLVGPSNLGVRPGDPIGQVVVVGREGSSFRQRVAEVFAANGIDVLEARLMTRADGVVVDSFRVRDDRTGGDVDPGKWGRVGQDLDAGLLGRLDTGDKVAARAAAYRETGGEKPEVTGAIDKASGDLVFTVKCADRIGRLAEILATFGDCGLDIRLAQIDSRAGEVVDTFHVVGSEPGLDIKSMEQRLSSALVP